MLPATRFAVLPAFAAQADKSVTHPRGFRAAGVAAGIKRSNRLDVGLLVSDEPCVSAAFFTRSAAAAAPVLVTRGSCACERLRAIVVNSGNANACTGPAGMRDARAMRDQAGTASGVAAEEVAVCSTGVIGQSLPMERVSHGIEMAAAKLSAAGGARFAAAIRTTDRTAKDGALTLDLPEGEVRLGFAAKGAGMISPTVVAASDVGATAAHAASDGGSAAAHAAGSAAAHAAGAAQAPGGHATMLCFVTCDARLPQPVWREMVADAVTASLNSITVDGQESTNDTVIALANGASGVLPGEAGRARLSEALRAAFLMLAIGIVADGEGSTKVVRLDVRGARDPLEGERVARAVADSPLVKAAFYGEDPNWGRVVQAAGQALARAETGAPSSSRTRPADEDSGAGSFEPDVAYGPLTLLRRGAPVELADPQREQLLHVMEDHEIELTLDLHRGAASSRVFFGDLTHQYVTFNAEYTT